MRREYLVEPLDRDVREALEIERVVVDAPDEAKRRVLDRVASTVGLFSASVALGAALGESVTSESRALANVAAPRWASPWWHVATFVLGSTAGALGWRATHEPPRPPIAYVERTPPPASAAPIPTVEAVAPAAPAPAPPVQPRSSTLASPSGSLAAERALLDAARSAFGRGEANEALAALARHEKVFPNGELAEEREALAVRSLVLDGKTNEARVRAARFRKRYPTSVMLPAVEASLDAPP